MQSLMAFIVGILFGIGLLVSGMADPSKVLGFLDLAGTWDPSLAFVMGGAILIGLLGFAMVANRPTSLLGAPMRLPAATKIDHRLVFGGLTFGAGWGLAGYCPGPAVVSLMSGNWKPILFTIAMLSGMAIYEIVESRPRGEQKKTALAK
jgi:uncharacterized membrane protein YedE/YeeE